MSTSGLLFSLARASRDCALDTQIEWCMASSTCVQFGQCRNSAFQILCKYLFNGTRLQCNWKTMVAWALVRLKNNFAGSSILVICPYLGDSAHDACQCRRTAFRKTCLPAETLLGNSPR